MHKHTHAGYHAKTHSNGFMNGVGDDGETEVDAYPEEGPLYSGTHSLRRIPKNTSSKMPMVCDGLVCTREGVRGGWREMVIEQAKHVNFLTS